VDIVTSATSGTNAGSTTNTTIPFTIGPSLDVIPTVNADGYTIHLVLVAALNELLGYDKPAQIAPQANGISSQQTPVPANAALPVPRFRVRQTVEPVPAGAPTNAAPPVPRFRSFSAVTAVNVWDGQTVLLGGPMQDSDASQQQSTNSQWEDVMVFITATIIDPAGNRVHTDEQMPFANKTIPLQPQSSGAPK
jgi:type II secretory pathway component GspD/PulD (secretin)